MDRVDAIFRQSSDGRILAVRNWRHRMEASDALVAIPLDDQEAETLERLRAEGLADDEIFDRLNASKPTPRPTIAIEELTVPQLARLVRQLVDHPMPALETLSGPELAALLRALCRRDDAWQAMLI